MLRIEDLSVAQDLLQSGRLLAYPTEAVYGLGCDPFNRQAVEALLALKQRSPQQGLILVVADWSQVFPLVQALLPQQLEQLRASWPGHVTWLCPKSALVPSWISGDHDTVALRMTAHPVARQLCGHGPLVSTSANRHGLDPAKTDLELQQQFPEGLDAVMAGDLGTSAQPSSIYDLRTGARLRG